VHNVLNRTLSLLDRYVCIQLKQWLADGVKKLKILIFSFMSKKQRPISLLSTALFGFVYVNRAIELERHRQDLAWKRMKTYFLPLRIHEWPIRKTIFLTSGRPPVRFARSFLVQHTNIVKIYQNYHIIYQMAAKL
jgi:hypothetical protein